MTVEGNTPGRELELPAIAPNDDWSRLWPLQLTGMMAVSSREKHTDATALAQGVVPIANLGSDIEGNARRQQAILQELGRSYVKDQIGFMVGQHSPDQAPRHRPR